ncbi:MULTISPECIES: thioesterase II family protein [Streptomyces]|uniref:thioesterase II family protein n=1 Tax=Streptomyces TaxID=1883 RepID=UPI000938EDE0|nr:MULTISPECIES: thioesterase domain-containing protein [Streptomyces]MBX9426795.1 thioesterase II family protein [Streptomyces lateritius]
MSGDTSVRLFCLPFEGASAGIYLPWAEALGTSVVVTPVELPGRGRHPRTRPCGRLEPLLAEIIPYVARMRDRPFALYGHGFGALLAYEIAARLEWEYDAVAERLYVSGAGVPYRPAPERSVAQLPDTELLRRLGERGRIPPGALDPLRAPRVLPALRADLAVREAYRRDPRHVVHCPVTAMGGSDDPSVTGADLAGWRRCTRRSLRVDTVPGDHYFPLTARWELLDTFSQDLMRPASRGGTRAPRQLGGGRARALTGSGPWAPAGGPGTGNKSCPASPASPSWPAEVTV